MTSRDLSCRRRGAVAVEAAIVYPVLLFLLFALVVLGMGVFRYQQVVSLAREAARYASVHGADREKDTDQAAPSQQQILDDVVTPLAVGLDPDNLTLRVWWVDQVSGQAVEWDGSAKRATTLTTAGEPVTARVRVQLTYRWVPEFVLAGPYDLRSTAEVPMSY